MGARGEYNPLTHLALNKTLDKGENISTSNLYNKTRHSFLYIYQNDRFYKITIVNDDPSLTIVNEERKEKTV